MNPTLDLVLTRVIDAPVSLVWEAYTNPIHLVKWWFPRPYTTRECRIDLRPGGVFGTVMVTPDGDVFDNEGIYLEVVDQKKIVFTDTLKPGYRPADEPFMTAVITFEEADGKTTYTATVLHRDKETRDRHEAMGFFDGWGTCANQLAEVAESLKG